MARSVNKVVLIGNLGRDAETKFLPSGVAITNFSLATERRWKDQSSGEWQTATDWIPVVLWKQEALSQYLTKGKQIYVSGRLSARQYEKDGQKRTAYEVVADEVILLGGNSGGESRISRADVPAKRLDDDFGGMGVDPSDVPF